MTRKTIAWLTAAGSTVVIGALVGRRLLKKRAAQQDFLDEDITPETIDSAYEEVVLLELIPRETMP